MVFAVAPPLAAPSHFFIVIFVTDGNRARGGGRAAGLPPVAGQADFFQDSKRNSIDALSTSRIFTAWFIQ